MVKGKGEDAWLVVKGKGEDAWLAGMGIGYSEVVGSRAVFGNNASVLLSCC